MCACFARPLQSADSRTVLGVRSELTWEIIVVDDNSPDGTQDVARQLAQVYGEDKIVCVVRCMAPALSTDLLARRC